MKRILFYVHFNKNDELADYVIYQLRKIKNNFAKVVFITNSKICESDKKRLEGLYDEFISRKNEGFDFAAWRDGIVKIGWEYIVKYDSMVVMNDTCFGPIFDTESIFAKMDLRKNTDFWGITNHKKHEKINEHIQSYFMSFSSKVIKNKVFCEFWENIHNYTDVKKVIDNYETKLTGILLTEGFSYATLINSKKYKGKYNVIRPDGNLSELYPIEIIGSNIPFVKIKSFKWVPTDKIIAKIRKVSDYPTKMIKDHLKNISLITMDDNIYEVMENYREFIDHQEEVINDLKKHSNDLENQIHDLREYSNSINIELERITNSFPQKTLRLLSNVCKPIYKRRK